MPEGTTIPVTVVIALAVLSWLVPHLLEIKRKRDESRLAFFEDQIENFLGPLAGIIDETFVVYDIASQVLPRNQNGQIDQDLLESDEQIETWRYFQETYFFKLNRQAVDLIIAKQHTLGPEIPGSFRELLGHAVELESLFGLWKSRGISSAVQGKPWPAELQRDVHRLLENAQSQYNKQLLKTRRN
ncbi:MAG: hypothetical protein AAGC44_07145 [Planctomycetota bacterium]